MSSRPGSHAAVSVAVRVGGSEMEVVLVMDGVGGAVNERVTVWVRVGPGVRDALFVGLVDRETVSDSVVVAVGGGV